MDLYKKAQVIIHDDAPWIPLVYAEEPLAAKANLQNYKPNPTGSEPFDEVYFK
jgi:peptide/nickel transport system substrate-binding protein